MPHQLNPLKRSKRESARIAYQDIKRREQQAKVQQEMEKEQEQTVERQYIGPSNDALEITRRNRCQHGFLKHFTDCPSPEIKIDNTTSSINTTQIAAGLTAITSTVVTPLATLLIGQLSNESDINNMAYNVTLPALSTSTEQSNNSIFTDYSDISLPIRILFAATGLIIGSAIVPIVLYAKGYYSCRKENNEEPENSNNHSEPENNQDAAEKGLLPTRSATLKTRAQTLQTSFMLAESASREGSKKINRNRHQFYKSLPASNSSLHEKENDHEAPCHSNS